MMLEAIQCYNVQILQTLYSEPAMDLQIFSYSTSYLLTEQSPCFFYDCSAHADEIWLPHIWLAKMEVFIKFPFDIWKETNTKPQFILLILACSKEQEPAKYLRNKTMPSSCENIQEPKA